MELENYLNDGANKQAQAVLCYLQYLIGDGIEKSWNDTYKHYDARIQVGRWENCREQGYIISLRNKKQKQINIAFFEHRNSDSICAVTWYQYSINSLTIDNAEFEGVYKNKYDVSKTVAYGEIIEMATYIKQTLENHWL